MTEQDKITENGKLGIDDEFGKDHLEQLAESIKKELDSAAKSLEDIDKAIDNYKEQWDVEDEMYQIRLRPGANQRINPSFAYEQDPRYSELIQTMVGFKYRQEKHLAEQRLESWAQEKELIRERMEAREKQLLEVQEMLEAEDE